jgi:hypothetical protein
MVIDFIMMIFPDLLLLPDGTKSSQNRDIERAVEWLKELKKRLNPCRIWTILSLINSRNPRRLFQIC